MTTFKKIPLLYFIFIFWGLSASGTTATAPQANSSIKADVQSNGNQYWTNVSIKLTNTNTTDIDLRNSSIEVNLPTAVNDVYGSYTPLSWPTILVSSVPNGSVTKVTINLTFSTESWVKTLLPPNQSITLQFGVASAVNNTLVSNSVKVYTNSPAPAPIGTLIIQSPQSPGSNAGNNASATLTGPITNPMQITLAWNSSKTISSLPMGTYTLHVNQVGSYPGGQDTQFTLSATNPNTTLALTYAPAIKTALLNINMPASPVANAPTPSIYLSNNGSSSVLSVPWGTSKQVSLIDGQVYTLWAADFSYGDNTYRSSLSETKPMVFTANAATATAAAPQFQASPIPTIAVTVQIQGLPQASSTVNVALINSNKTYPLNGLKNGSYPVTVQPGTYTVDSNSYTVQGKSYSATLSNPYVLTEGSTISITYNEVKSALLMPFKDMTYNMNWSTTPAFSNLKEIADNSKHYSYVMAFITQNQWDNAHCYPAWGGQPSLALKDKFYQQEVQYLQSQNGSVAVSFGGENGVSIESKCTQTELEQVYQSALDIYGAAFLDFDIEGGALGDTAANTNRFKALKSLQAKNANAKVTLTLPANTDGFPPYALALIQEGKNLGVSIKEYNMMTMAWYSQKLPGPISDSVIASAQKGFQQLQAIFPEKSAAQIWSMIRVTPKIGVDYDQSILYLDDAKRIGQFVKQNGLAGIGFWSADIDRNQNKTQNCNQGANPDCSGISQAPYDFTRNFLSGLMN